MKKQRLFCTVAAGCLLLALGACQDEPTGPDPQVALAKGEGGNGGKGENGGSPDVQGLYSDLVFLLRDVYGRPLLKTFTVLGEEGVETATCVQPVSYRELPLLGAVTSILDMDNPVNGRRVWLIPLAGDFMTPAASATPAVKGKKTVSTTSEEESELGPCDPYGEFNADGTVIFSYGDYATEVPFGRLNMGRAPQRTVDRAYAEVDLKLGAAGFILLDHGGRWAPDGVAIDAPAENLVIHRELVVNGGFASYRSPAPAGDPEWYDFLHHAASTLAGAADKFGYIIEDLVVYNNAILGFPQMAAGDGGMDVIAGDGTSGFSGVMYLDYSDFGYTRSVVFPGCVEYGGWEDNEPVRYRQRIMDAVFGGVDAEGENLHGFTLRADDARALILFEHDYWINRIDRIGESSLCDVLFPPEPEP